VGGADPIYGNLYDQRTSPLSESKALINLSKVPPANTKLPAVAVAPPKFAVPVSSKPLFLSSSKYPKGTCHIIFPLFKFSAVKLPHGGVIPGYPSRSSSLLFFPISKIFVLNSKFLLISKELKNFNFRW